MRTPYGPFVEALDRLVRVTEAEELRAALGTGGGELTRLLPDLPALASASCRSRSRPTPTPSATASTPRSPTCSRTSAASRPMLLVLEDGHWADAPTLLLLRHLARSAWQRPAAAPRRPSATPRPTCRRGLAETLADLRRAEDVVRMRLPGLSGAEVSDLVSRAAGERSRPRAARAREHDPRPHRRQRLPRLRALARPGRDRDGRGRRRSRSG